MKAGIDFGSTLTKAAWHKGDGTYALWSTRDGAEYSFQAATPQGRMEVALRARVDTLRATGIGRRWLQGFVIEEAAADQIEDEIHLQADGARRLLTLEGRPLDSFLLVSVGTGVSYTRVVEGKAERFPFGSAIGGGFIAGLANIFCWKTLGEIEKSIAGAKPLNLLVRDVLPTAVGTPMGEFVVAHFGKHDADERDGHTPAKIMATVLHMVATSIMRDVMMMSLMPNHRPPGALVFVGSTLATFPTLAGYIDGYARMFGIETRFPVHGEFSAAIGALHAP